MGKSRSAAQERVHLASSAPSGNFSPGGASSFREKFRDAKSLDAFLKWRENPVTVAFLAALRSFSMTPPAAFINPESVEVQYGVQSGLVLACSLADDPSSVFPELFGGPVTVGAPEEDQLEYSTPPDRADAGTAGSPA